MPTSPYLTADEAATYLRYPSTHAFRVDIPKKGIPHIKRGCRLLFTRQALDEFMAVVTEASYPRMRRRPDQFRVPPVVIGPVTREQLALAAAFAGLVARGQRVDDPATAAEAQRVARIIADAL